MIPQILKKQPFRDFILDLDTGRRTNIVADISRYLKPGNKIIDIGCGMGGISKLLKNRDFNVTSLDIQNGSLYDDVAPIVYDGSYIPFKNNSFDVALLITVLHHTPNPEAIIREARRVAHKIIIIEDTYEGALQKYVTFAMDSICNLEFFGHPHTNKSDAGWRDVFQKLQLKEIDSKAHPYWNLFSSTTYALEK